jgi:hypothetical protein
MPNRVNAFKKQLPKTPLPMDSTFAITDSLGEITFIDGYLILGLEHIFSWFIIYFKNKG